MQRVFATIAAHLGKYWWQYLRYAGLAVLVVVGVILAAGVAVGVFSFGATFYAAIAAAVALFFAVAWQPYAIFLAFVGFCAPKNN
ncbi:hypothetical protein [Yoonia sediminilitoris]|nr:hypothetical protein [Yoonia sediminilitoris]